MVDEHDVKNIGGSLINAAGAPGTAVKNGGDAYADDQAARDYVKYGYDETKENVLLSAAAGSGKTRTLVERIVEKAKTFPEGRHIDSIAVVTFTRAAAAELVTRIEKALSNEIDLLRRSGRDAEAAKLVDELYLLPKASIGTIDAFCLELVRKNFTSVKSCRIDSSFVLDDDIVDVIRKDVAANVLEEYYAMDRNSDEGRIIRNILTAHKAFRDDNSFVDTLMSICDFCDSLPDPEQWLKTLSSRFETEQNVCDNVWYKRLKEEYVRVLDEARDHAEKAIKATVENAEDYSLLSESEIGAYTKQYANAISLIDSEKERLSIESPDAPALFATRKLTAKDFGGSSPGINKNPQTDDEIKKNNLKQCLQTELSTIRDSVQGFFTGVLESIIKTGEDPASRAAVFIKGITEVGEYVSLIAEIVGKIYKGTIEECAKRKSFSFSEIAHFALEVLCKEDTVIGNETPETLVPSDVAKAYRRTYSEIYVDEYQDTSMLQEFILYQVSGIADGINNMIMVGDIKQSIYSFRNAKPRLMLEKAKSFDRNEGGVLKFLSRNFRSRKGVIDGVNEVFSRIMTAEASDIDYEGGGHRLAYGAVKKYENIQDTGDPQNGRCELIYSSAKGLEAEAAVIASKISTLKTDLKVQTVLRDEEGNPVRDEDGFEVSALRDLRYSDICIIVGKNNNATRISGCLEKAGFPVDIRSVDRYFDRREVNDILSFVRVIDNPRNDIPLAGVLCSDYFGFTENELAEIRCEALGKGADKKTDFWEVLVASCDGEEESRSKTLRKAAGAVKLINELRDLSENITVSSFVWKLINFNDYYKNHDDICKGNLRAFLEFSYPFDKGVSGGLYGFVKHMDRMASEDAGKDEYKREKSYIVASEATDKIQIMTAHKSKGLEFPVVFYAATNQLRGGGDGALNCDEDLGIGLEFQYDDGGTYKKLGNSAPNIVMKQAKEEAARKELQRVVYVALTRAMEKLFVIGSRKSDKDNTMINAFISSKVRAVVSSASIRSKETPFGMILLGTAVKDSVWNKEILSEDDVSRLMERFFKEDEEEEEAGEVCGDVADETAGDDDELTKEKEDVTRKEEAAGGLTGEESLSEEEDSDVRTVTEALEIANQGAMPVKISVSQLKRFAADDGETLEEGNVFRLEAKEFPSGFGRESGTGGDRNTGAEKGAGNKAKKLKGAKLGTLMHKVMKLFVEDRQNWPGRDPGATADYIDHTVKELCARGVIDQPEEPSVDRGMIKRFLLSDRAAEVKAAEKVRCEIPFTYRADVAKYLPFAKRASENSADEGIDYINSFKSSLKERNIIALQGVIDLYYKIGTRVVVLDFKTDNKSFAAGEKTLEAYLLQIRCYRDAIEEISGQKPAESLLFFLSTGEEVRLKEDS